MWRFIPNLTLADVTYMFPSFFFLKNNQKNFRPSIIKVFGRFYFFFLFFGLFLFLVFSFVLDLPKVRTSRKKVFLSKFGPNLLQVDEQSTSFLSLMPKRGIYLREKQTKTQSHKRDHFLNLLLVVKLAEASLMA